MKPQYLVVLLFFFAGSTTAQDCNTVGLCLGDTIYLNDEGTYEDCVERCKDLADDGGDDGCAAFTFDTSDSLCLLYSDCDEVDESCSSCVSGNSECESVFCSVEGECLGTLLGEEEDSEEECAALCEDDRQCEYFTYFEESGGCALFETCRLSGEGCDDCSTSQKGCSGGDGDGDGDGGGDEATLLLVFKTFNFAEISVIDLDDDGRECDTRDATALSQTSEPLSVHGTAVGGKILACGFTPSECFEYDVEADQWTPSDVARNEIRYVPYGLDIGDQHWVFGGGNKVTSDSTEYYDGEDFVSAFDLPLDTDHTCVVDLLDGTILVATGNGMGNNAYVIDLDSGDERQVADFPEGGGIDIISATCGLAVRSEDSARLVVFTGGDIQSSQRQQTSIYDVDAGVWTPGPFLPVPLGYGRAVQYRNSFLVVGGDLDNLLGGPYNDQIFFYDPDVNDWEVLPQTLNDPDLVLTAFIVQESLVPCKI